MRSRVAGAVLFGLGVLALVFAAGLAFVVGPRVARLPYDLVPTQSIAVAPDARFLQIKEGGAVTIEQADLRSTITVTPDRDATSKLEGDLDGDAVVWLVGQQVERTDTSELISAYSTSLALDRRSAAAVTWDGQWLDTGNDRQPVDYSGQIYKFPFDTQKKTYPIFDRDILAAQPANFVGTEEINGLETYQFRQEIRGGRQEVPDDRMAALVAALLPDAETGEIIYSNTRTVWVEPTTGQYIKVQEFQQKSLVGDNGDSVAILDALFTYTDETIASSADRAADNRNQLRLVSLWGPIGLAVVGAALLIAGLVLATRRGRGRHAGAPDATTESLPGGAVKASP
jgi:hypothetical protein